MASSDERAITPGDRVDGYVLGPALGKGATARVFEARWTKDGEATAESVAIKIMRGDVSEDPRLRARFDRELEVLRRIRSPHVPRVTDTGELDGLPYVVMERLRGGTLHDRLAEAERLPLEEALDYAIQLASALAAAHEAGVVHRDVKPSNLVLHRDAEGAAAVLKLVDFGICVPIGEDEPKLTLPGKTVGTPDYMSPEQARGMPVDARSDVFSVGSVLYEMLSGRCPFRGRNAEAIARAVTRKTPRPVRKLREDCPEALSRLVERAMAKKREDRFASAIELRDALTEVASSLDGPREVVEVGRGETLAMSALAPGRRALELHPELDPPASEETQIVELPLRPLWQRAAAAAIAVVGIGWGVLHVSGRTEAAWALATGEPAARRDAVALASADDPEPFKQVSPRDVDDLDVIAQVAGRRVDMPAVSRAARRASISEAAPEEMPEETAAASPARARRARRREPPPSTTVMTGGPQPSEASAREVSAVDLEEAARTIERSVRLPAPPAAPPPPFDDTPGLEPAPPAEADPIPRSPYDDPPAPWMPDNPY